MFHLAGIPDSDQNKRFAVSGSYTSCLVAAIRVENGCSPETIDLPSPEICVRDHYREHNKDRRPSPQHQQTGLLGCSAKRDPLVLLTPGDPEHRHVHLLKSSLQTGYPAAGLLVVPDDDGNKSTPTNTREAIVLYGTHVLDLMSILDPHLESPGAKAAGKAIELRLCHTHTLRCGCVPYYFIRKIDPSLAPSARPSHDPA